MGLGGLGAVGTGAVAGTGGGIGAGASVAGLEIWPPVSGGEPPAPFDGGRTCGEEDGGNSSERIEIMLPQFQIGPQPIFKDPKTYIYVEEAVELQIQRELIHHQSPCRLLLRYHTAKQRL